MSVVHNELRNVSDLPHSLIQSHSFNKKSEKEVKKTKTLYFTVVNYYNLIYFALFYIYFFGPIFAQASSAGSLHYTPLHKFRKFNEKFCTDIFALIYAQQEFGLLNNL